MSAQMQGEMQPAIYRFRLGSFEAASILDNKIIREGLGPSYGGESLSAEVRALARANRIDPHRYMHRATALRLARDFGAIVLGARSGEKLGEVGQQVKAIGAEPLVSQEGAAAAPGPAVSSPQCAKSDLEVI